MDTFKITTPAVNQKFIRRCRSGTNTSQKAADSNNYSVNHAFLGFAILQR